MQKKYDFASMEEFHCDFDNVWRIIFDRIRFWETVEEPEISGKRK